jgi:hypothetical protein
MPKDPIKAARKRAELDWKSRIKKQIQKAETGSSGPAGKVRHIDPKDYKPQD